MDWSNDMEKASRPIAISQHSPGLATGWREIPCLEDYLEDIHRHYLIISHQDEHSKMIHAYDTVK